MSQQQNQQQTNEPEFGIQRLYVKDSSFEAPNVPAIFRKEWQPELGLDLHTHAEKIDNDIHEVTLTVTVTAKLGEETAFLVEVKQAGIFTLSNFSNEQLKPMIGSFCPNILFPYAREVITDMVVRGGFPPLYLSPINFDALYQQHLQEQQGEAGGKQGQGEGIIQTH